jgi:hypothetical protein
MAELSVFKKEQIEHSRDPFCGIRAQDRHTYGMKLYQLYPPGLPIVSIPWHHIDRVLKNIREMPWTLPGYTDYKEELYQIGHQRLGVDQIV